MVSVCGILETLTCCAGSHMARRTFCGNLYKRVKDPDIVASMSGHKEGSNAFARYREIGKDIKNEALSVFEWFCL